MDEPRKTALHAWHAEQGARLVPFAGWVLPIQYAGGIISEHEACRNAAALFDVSHMGQVFVPGDPDAAAVALETRVPSDLRNLPVGRAKYSVLLTDEGTVADDLMLTRVADGWRLVVNAARTAADLALLEASLPAAHRPVLRQGRSLLAVQGPLAERAVAAMLPEVEELTFLDGRECFLEGQPVFVSRLGYTGEDGFEFDLPDALAMPFATRLQRDTRVTPAGLGARDSLRLEAGLCLYGHDIDTTVNPAAAGLGWVVSKRRREAKDFPGAEAVVAEIASGAAQRFVGMTLEGRLPAREGAVVFAGDEAVGRVTSGGFAPSLGHPIAMGYVDAEHATPGTALGLQVRRHVVNATVTKLPFVPHRYHR
ncbi:MAG: glycine cleavage system aminomethyltransferase GcvT [Pseudomonadota bacterium]